MNVANVGIAAGAGVISITSPCCLPLLPGYLGYLTGMSATELGERRPRAVAAALLFTLGFTTVFALLGATATAAGRALILHRHGLEQVAGVIVVLVGLTLLLGERLPLLARSREWTQRWAAGQLWAAAPLGAAFAITWTPCIGPVLAGILTLAASTEQVGDGILLLTVYSLGLAVPFVALSFSVPRVRRWLRRVGRGAAIARLASSVVLVVMGVLLVTDRWLPLMAPLLRLYARAQWPPV